MRREGNMKRFISILIVIILLGTFCSCGKYVSSYKALGLVRTQTSHSCEASFYSLDGHLVFKIRKSDVGSEGDISYSVDVDKGEVYLYYDIYGSKEELAHVKAGESVTDRGGYVEGGHDVYIIIEASKGSKGKLSVELDG